MLIKVTPRQLALLKRILTSGCKIDTRDIQTFVEIQKAVEGSIDEKPQPGLREVKETIKVQKPIIKELESAKVVKEVNDTHKQKKKDIESYYIDDNGLPSFSKLKEELSKKRTDNSNEGDEYRPPSNAELDGMGI